MSEKELEWHVSDGVDLKIKELPEGYSEDDIDFRR